MTAPLRRPPEVILIGGMRCGSTSVYQTLTAHPDVRGPTWKEIHFFDLHYERGMGWYRSFFPVRPDRVVSIDATPSYMAHPQAAARVESVLPDVKLIGVLRDPVERAWSHFRFRRTLGLEQRSFAEALADETSLRDPLAIREFDRPGDIGYIAGGNYVDQLTPWMNRFEDDQMLIIGSESLFSDVGGSVDSIFSFLGLSGIATELAHVNSSPSDQLDPEDEALLSEVYRAPNERLKSLLGGRLPWVASP